MSQIPLVEHISFDAKLDNLEPMIGWVKNQLAELNFSKQLSDQVQLALEEALVNVINYAYEEEGKIDLIATINPDSELRFCIIDSGIPFNPLTHAKKPDISEDLMKQKEGGLGIFFICKMMDQVDYQRKDPFNVLTLIKTM